MSNSSELQSKAITFKFNKKSKQNPIDLNAIKNSFNQNNNTVNECTDFVTCIDDKQIKGSVEKVVEHELIIPLIKTNRYVDRVKKDLTKNNYRNNIEVENQVNDSLEELAKKELLREANEWKNSETSAECSRVIPVINESAIDSMIQNRVPKGFESDDKFDVSLRPSEPSLDNYQSVPVEEFGLAMLRGMGWKPGEAIGGVNKGVYTPLEPQIRPKGLGLGAESSLKEEMNKIKTNIKSEEALVLKKGALVCIEFGSHKGSYGVIEDFDDDMSRVTVKLSIKRESIKTPVALVRVVSKKEFQTESNVINKTKYDLYKEKEVSNKVLENERKHRDRHRDRVKTKSTDEMYSINARKNEYNTEDSHRSEASYKTWLYPNLKVRIIDKDYKNGKYYKEKVTIIDVFNPYKCCCKTDDNKLLDDMDLKMLETVIPRSNDMNVMILYGKHIRELGVIVEKDKNRNEASVQLLSDRRKIVTLSYDHICQYSK